MQVVHQVVEGGQVAVSIQICTKREVETRPNGFGRDDPNSNPFLPPPVGRMQMVGCFGYRPRLDRFRYSRASLLLHLCSTEFEPVNSHETAAGPRALESVLLLPDVFVGLHCGCPARFVVWAVHHAAQVTCMFANESGSIGSGNGSGSGSVNEYQYQYQQPTTNTTSHLTSHSSIAKDRLIA